MNTIITPCLFLDFGWHDNYKDTLTALIERHPSAFYAVTKKGKKGRILAKLAPSEWRGLGLKALPAVLRDVENIYHATYTPFQYMVINHDGILEGRKGLLTLFNRRTFGWGDNGAVKEEVTYKGIHSSGDYEYVGTFLEKA